MASDDRSIKNPLLGFEEFLICAAIGLFTLLAFSQSYRSGFDKTWPIEISLYRQFGKPSLAFRVAVESLAVWLPFGLACGAVLARRPGIYAALTAAAAVLVAWLVSRTRLQVIDVGRWAAFALTAYAGGRYGASIKHSYKVPILSIAATTKTAILVLRAVLDVLLWLFYFATLAMWSRTIIDGGNLADPYLSARTFVSVGLMATGLARFLVRGRRLAMSQVPYGAETQRVTQKCNEP